MAYIPIAEARGITPLMIKVVLDALGKIRRVVGLEKPEMKSVNADTGEELRNIRTLNVYEEDSGTFLFSESIGEKTNEIPHVRSLLASMNLRNVIVTFDAMNTQKGTVAVIAKGKGDYCGDLEGNQSSLHEYAGEFFDGKTLERISGDPKKYRKTSEIAHNQREEREFFVHVLTKRERDGEFRDWAGARSIVCCRKHIVNTITGRKTTEKRTYVTSLVDIDLISYSIRRHGGCEANHWYLDTVMGEDNLRTIDRTAALNISIMNKAILSLYKRFGELLNSKEKVSKRRIRFMFSWDFKGMLAKLLSLFDEKTLREALTITPKGGR